MSRPETVEVESLEITVVSSLMVKEGAERVGTTRKRSGDCTTTVRWRDIGSELTSSLSYSAGPISSSFSAESLALVHGLEWCHSDLKTCSFQLVLFLTESQSALSLHSTAPEFLQPKSSFW